MASRPRSLAADPRHRQRDFEAAHRKQFGFVFEDKALVVESLEVEAVGGGADIDEPEQPLADDAPQPHADTPRLHRRRLARRRSVFLRAGTEARATRSPARR